jgi:hypothetical protein
LPLWKTKKTLPVLRICGWRKKSVDGPSNFLRTEKT